MIRKRCFDFEIISHHTTTTAYFDEVKTAGIFTRKKKLPCFYLLTPGDFSKRIIASIFPRHIVLLFFWYLSKTKTKNHEAKVTIIIQTSFQENDFAYDLWICTCIRTNTHQMKKARLKLKKSTLQVQYITFLLLQ